MKKFFLILMCLLILPFSVRAEAMDENVYNEQIKALFETARAYRAQGLQVQYDSYRKSLFASPEDATSRHTVYTVCSGFIYMSYYQALGIKIPDSTDDLLRYGFKFKYTNNTIFYYNNDNKTDEMIASNVRTATKALGLKSMSEELTDEKKQKFIDDIIDKVKPGDIFVYKRKTGHAMLVKSVDKKNGKIYLMEGDGGRYDYNNHVDNVETKHGAIYDNIDMMNRLYADSTELTMIRIIDKNSTVFPRYNKEETKKYNQTPKVTEAASSRIRLNNIYIAKVMSDKVANQEFASLGSVLEYKIKITNNSTDEKKYGKFTVAEYIDTSMVDIVDDGGGQLLNKEGSIKQLKWSFDGLEYGNSITITYSVKIKNNPSLIGKLYVSTGRVSNIGTSKIETLIGNRLTKAEKSLVLDEFKNKKNDKKYEAGSGVEFISDLYNDALKLDLGLMFNDGNGKRSVKNSDFIFYKKDLETLANDEDPRLIVRYTILSKKYPEFKTIKKYLFGNFYGLRIDENSNASKDLVKATFAWDRYAKYELFDRARSIKSEYLENGDVVLAYVNKSSTDSTLAQKAYIYFGEALHRYRPSSKDFEVLKGDSLTNFLNNLVGDNYIILRPYVDNSINSISISAPKVEYGIGDSFNKSVGSVVLNYEDGSTKKISLSDPAVKISGFSSKKVGQKEVTVEYKHLTTTFKVNVSKKVLSAVSPSLDLTTFVFPIKSTYSRSDNSLDLTGGYISIENEDGRVEYISLTNDNVVVSGFDNTKLGKNTITVEYKDLVRTFEVEISDKKVKSISVNDMPLKKNYLLNFDNLDLTGGVLLVTFEDGSTDLVSMSNETVIASGFDNKKLGKNTVNLEYNGVNCSFDVEVINKTIKSITIENLPYLLEYQYGQDDLDLTNGTILVTYDDGSSEVVSLENLNISTSGFDNKKTGTNTVLIKYGDASTTLDVEVIGDDIKDSNTSNDEKENNNNNMIIYICIGSILLIGIVSFIFIFKKKKKENEEKDKNNESLNN